MTELLKQIMNDRADRLEDGGPDLGAILNDGRARARRRRAGVGAAGLVAAATAAAIVVPMLVGGSEGDRQGTEVAASSVPGMSWAEGSTIHSNGETIDVGQEIHAYVASDDGYVLTDPDNVVWSWVDGEISEVGEVRDGWGQVLIADGSQVAWLDVRSDAWEFVVLDQRTGARAELEADVPAGLIDGEAGEPDPEQEAQLEQAHLSGVEVTVHALDGTVLYARDARGVVKFNAASGDVEVLAPLKDGYAIDDVANGRMLFTRFEGDANSWETKGTFASTDLERPGVRLPTDEGDLSPDGRYAMSENSAESSDDFTLVDIDAGAEIEVDANSAYDFFTGFAWVDSGTFVAVGMNDEGSDAWSSELLTCVVATATCELVAGGPTSLELGGFQLPIGEHLGE